MTSEGLSELRSKSLTDAGRKLQMPPVMETRREEPRVLEQDQALKG